MTEQELRELALKLDEKFSCVVLHPIHGMIVKHSSGAWVGIEEIVRAAVAHGLRMGAQLCQEERLSGETDDAEDMAYEHAITHCRASIMGKADELEAAK